jgi:hypothetical protein
MFYFPSSFGLFVGVMKNTSTGKTPINFWSITIVGILVALCFIAPTRAVESLTQQQCKTVAPTTVRSDPRKPTWIYHWTEDLLARDDPLAYLKKRLNAQDNPLENNKAFCAGCMEAQARIKQGRSDFRVPSVPGLMGGHGLYFARDPFSSRFYGKYLVAISVPARKTFGHFGVPSDPNPLATVDLILSDHGGIVYEWATSIPAVVIRDFQFLEGAGFRFWSVDATPRVPLTPMQLMKPINIRAPLKVFLRHFRDFISFISFRAGKMIVEGSSLDDIVLQLIDHQWSQRAGKLSRAGASNAQFHLPQEILRQEASQPAESDWQKMVEFLKKIDYLQNGAVVPYGDEKAFKTQLLARFVAHRNGYKALRRMVEVVKRIMTATPTIMTWKK